LKTYAALFLFACFAFACLAQAATTSTTLSVQATVSIGAGGSFSATGTASLTGFGSGTFSAPNITTTATGNLNAPYTITISGSTLTCVITIPASVISGTATGSATITGGTGTFSGATGSFPTLNGTGGLAGTSFAVTFSGAGSITTSGSTGGGSNQPTITQVADAAAYGSTIAQGSIFIVKGVNLSASGFTQFSFPLPQSQNGVSVTFTPASGGSGTQAYLIYTYNLNGVNQIAAILPSTLAAGPYNVTVTNGGTTGPPFQATVVAQKFNLFTQDSTGSGLVVAQNFISASQLDINRLTTGTVSGFTVSPAKPGQTLILWGTGLGPVTGGDNVGAAGGNIPAANVQVVVGGMTVSPLYAGRAPGLAGEDQINVTLPANVPTGCTVALQVSVNGTLSNSTYLSIAPAGSNACVQPGLTTAQLQSLDQGGTITSGGFTLAQFEETIPSIGTVKLDQASGAFTQFTYAQLGAVTSVSSAAANGSCQVSPLSNTTASILGGGGIALDAGQITLSGPSGSNLTNQTLTQTNNFYSAILGEEGLSTSLPGIGNGVLVPGTYTLNGVGGKDVGKFTASLTLGTPLTVTGGLPSTVTRSSGLTLNWTGGNSTDVVVIFGSAGTVSGTGATRTTTGASFICLTTAGVGTFTVPASILNQLPAVTSAQASSGAGSTSLEVVSSPSPGGTFTAPLTAGGNVTGTFVSLRGAANQPTYQ